MTSRTLILTGLVVAVFGGILPGTSGSLLAQKQVKLPFGFPPQSAENAVDRAAPDECLFLLSWAGTKSIDENSDRAAMPDIEKFLSEEEIVQSLKSVLGAIDDATRGEEQELRLMTKWVPKLLAHPGMIFVEDVTFDGGPQFKAGGIIDLQEDAEGIQPALRRLFKDAPADAVADIEVDGKTFRKINIDDEVNFLLGVDGSNMILATSEEIAKRLMNVKDAARPMWLTELQTKSKVRQRSISLFVNIQEVAKRSGMLEGIEADIDKLMGVSSLESLSIISGFDDAGYLSHGVLRTKDGANLGRVFDILSEKPITAETFKFVPEDATLALAIKLDPQRFINSQREGWKDNADALADFENSMAEYKDEIGLSLEKDMLPAFGDELVVYHSKPEGGLLSGFTATIDVKNVEVAKKIEAMLLEQWKPVGESSWYDPRYFSSEFAGETIHTFVHSNSFSPILMPSFCVTKERVIVSLLPQNIQTILLRDDDFKSLASSKAITSQLTDGDSVVLYNNSPEFLKAVYPLMQFGVFFLQEEMGIEGIDPGIIPSGEVLMRHLKKDVSTFGRNGGNLEYVSRTSLPGLDHLLIVGAGAFIAEEGMSRRDMERLMSLFSPGRSKELQAKNNLRQIGLGMHNYHDTFKKFPAAAMPSREDMAKEEKDRKPLLSWRVHILPFVEEAALYDQFHLDEPWDSEHNIKLVEKMPKVYMAPGSKAEAGKTNYVTIRSDESAFPGVKQMRLADITDGSSNTIMTIEVSDKNAVTWSKPDDFTPDPMHPIKDIVGLRRNGFMMLRCDGSVEKMADDISAEYFNAIMTRNGGEVTWEFEEEMRR